MFAFSLERLISKPILEQIDNVTAYVGDNVTVVCKAISDGSPHFQWLTMNEGKTNMTVLKPKLGQHQYLVPSRENKWHGVKLFFPNVSYEDQGEYTCMAGNNIGMGFSSFFLQVIARPTAGAGNCSC